MMIIYKGYSTYNYMSNGTFQLNDIKLVNMDILNHIFTDRGSRVKMPIFGTDINKLLFKKISPDTTTIIDEQIRTVIDYDPRVKLISLIHDTQFDQHSISFHVDLLYVELNMQDRLTINLNFNSTSF